MDSTQEIPKLEQWWIHEAYGAWVAEEPLAGYTVWARTLDELKTVFKVSR